MGWGETLVAQRLKGGSEVSQLLIFGSALFQLGSQLCSDVVSLDGEGSDCSGGGVADGFASSGRGGHASIPR